MEFLQWTCSRETSLSATNAMRRICILILQTQLVFTSTDGTLTAFPVPRALLEVTQCTRAACEKSEQVQPSPSDTGLVLRKNAVPINPYLESERKPESSLTPQVCRTSLLEHTQLSPESSTGWALPALPHGSASGTCTAPPGPCLSHSAVLVLLIPLPIPIPNPIPSSGRASWWSIPTSTGSCGGTPGQCQQLPPAKGHGHEALPWPGGTAMAAVTARPGGQCGPGPRTQPGVMAMPIPVPCPSLPHTHPCPAGRQLGQHSSLLHTVLHATAFNWYAEMTARGKRKSPTHPRTRLWRNPGCNVLSLPRPPEVCSVEWELVIFPSQLYADVTKSFGFPSAKI